MPSPTEPRPPPGWATGPDPLSSAVLDTRALRAMAHPVRLRLIGVLRANGPSTATRLAEDMGLNSGATSYHLRQLAAGGFIVEDEERGTGRDRWWRAVHRSTWFDPATVDPADRGTATAYLQAVATTYAERMHRAVEEFGTLPPQWQDAWDISDFRMRLTPDELKELLARIGDLISARRQDLAPDDPAYKRGPAGSEAIVLQLQAFVAPDGSRDAKRQRPPS